VHGKRSTIVMNCLVGAPPVVSMIQREDQQRAIAQLERELPDVPGRSRRIHDLYMPVFRWLSSALERTEHRPLVAGISAPQGAGKTTLVGHLVPRFTERGQRAVAISIDDFYLSYADQQKLADSHPDNPYLRYRGYPGTHEVALGTSTLQALRRLGKGEELSLPVYDKSAHGGRGDRAPESSWRRVVGPFDLVLVEGWMLGFRARDESDIIDAHLRAINANLAAYDAWHAAIEAMVIMTASDPRHVVRWRVEAEEAMKAEGKPGLERAAIEDYIRRFLPAYELYADTVAGGRWADGRQLVFTLGEDRLPVDQPSTLTPPK
jgi:D-glycerate 3-kinase